MDAVWLPGSSILGQAIIRRELINKYCVRDVHLIGKLLDILGKPGARCILGWTVTQMAMLLVPIDDVLDIC